MSRDLNTFLNELKFTGCLMSADKRVAHISDNVVDDIYIENLLPNIVDKGLDIRFWLEGRAADSSRPNSRTIKRLIPINYADDAFTAFYVYGAKVTDNYWLKEENSNLCYSDVRFNDDSLSDAALKGDLSVFINNKANPHSPELTSRGSYEKGWKLENGVWFLWKNNSNAETFSEYATYLLGKYFDFDIAEYEPIKGFIRSRDFTENGKYNLEEMVNYIRDRNEDYVYDYNYLKQMSPELALQYFYIITLDAIVFNTDRHVENFGVLRDAEDGHIVKLAPNYDNNMSLLYSFQSSATPKNTHLLLIKDYEKLVKEASLNVKIKELDKETLESILKQANISNLVSEDDLRFAVEFVWNRYLAVKEILKQ